MTHYYDPWELNPRWCKDCGWYFGHAVGCPGEPEEEALEEDFEELGTEEDD